MWHDTSETQTKCNPGASASMAVRKVSSRNSSELTKILITECNSVWHPLKGPLVDWPLAVCDASSVDFTADTMPGDVVGRDEVFENTQVHYNAEQRWYWLPDQLSSELMIFKNADSRSPDGMAAEGTATFYLLSCNVNQHWVSWLSY